MPDEHSHYVRSESRHHWRIDSMENGVARLEPPQGRRMYLPAAWLPADARENDLLRLRSERDGDSSTLRFERDVEATEAALQHSRDQVERIRRASRERDPGGDIAL
jgi:hypothetical protein